MPLVNLTIVIKAQRKHCSQKRRWRREAVPEIQLDLLICVEVPSSIENAWIESRARYVKNAEPVAHAYEVGGRPGILRADVSPAPRTGDAISASNNMYMSRWDRGDASQSLSVTGQGQGHATKCSLMTRLHTVDMVAEGKQVRRVALQVVVNL